MSRWPRALSPPSALARSHAALRSVRPGEARAWSGSFLRLIRRGDGPCRTAPRARPATVRCRSSVPDARALVWGLQRERSPQAVVPAPEHGRWVLSAVRCGAFRWSAAC